MPGLILTAAAVSGLIATCGGAPMDTPFSKRLLAIAQHESGLDALVIGVNEDKARGLPRQIVRSSTAAEATAKARALLAQGRSIDLGLMQLNARYLPENVTLADTFEPCRNVAAGAVHFRDDREAAILHLASMRFNCGRFDCNPAYADAVAMRASDPPPKQEAPTPKPHGFSYARPASAGRNLVYSQ